MDGSKRWTLVSTNIRYPTGLAIDYNHYQRRVYFVDTKLSKIESVKQNGEDRVTILQSENLRHPSESDI